ncbi:hypothetical protein HU147_12560 [Planomicrobium chinense]|uniref:hypothetical protein n=1 Tax=Planococcus chinensis TaxID=272917 RepID=UPI001CC35531|nr:hypothetical protein [Planococcus chinensis]MBZ5202052.1 hypothetical protein [Planococcus chinensis]
MKKYWKQITLGLTVVLLAVAGYLVYAFEFKEYETADKEVDKVTEEKIEVDLPDDSKIVVDEEGNVTEEKDEDKEEDKEADTTEDATASTNASTTASNSTSGTVQTAAASTNSQTAGASTEGKSSNGNSDLNNGNASNGNKGTNNGNNGNNGSNNGNGGSNNGNNNGGNNGNNGSNNGKERVTVTQIKARYETSLTRLEDTANDRIDGLVNVAKKEYLADSSPNYAYYYNKYTGAASKLESQMDAAFYGVIGVMKRDLKANGLAESHVKSVINEYENTKKQRRNALMKKAAGLK